MAGKKTCSKCGKTGHTAKTCKAEKPAEQPAEQFNPVKQVAKLKKQEQFQAEENLNNPTANAEQQLAEQMQKLQEQMQALQQQQAIIQDEKKQALIKQHEEKVQAYNTAYNEQMLAWFKEQFPNIAHEEIIANKLALATYENLKPRKPPKMGQVAKIPNGTKTKTTKTTNTKDPFSCRKKCNYETEKHATPIAGCCNCLKIFSSGTHLSIAGYCNKKAPSGTCAKHTRGQTILSTEHKDFLLNGNHEHTANNEKIIQELNL